VYPGVICEARPDRALHDPELARERVEVATADRVLRSQVMHDGYQLSSCTCRGHVTRGKVGPRRLRRSATRPDSIRVGTPSGRAGARGQLGRWRLVRPRRLALRAGPWGSARSRS
jgi:hypothetical protein